MAENNVNIEIRNDFNQIFGIISYHRQRVSKTIDDESLRMIWEVGGYISHKLKNVKFLAVVWCFMCMVFAVVCIFVKISDYLRVF